MPDLNECAGFMTKYLLVETVQFILTFDFAINIEIESALGILLLSLFIYLFHMKKKDKN